MRVRYTTTPDDLVVFSQFRAETSPTIRRVRRRVATIVSLIALTLGGLLDLSLRTLFFAPAAILFVVIFLVVYRRRYAPTLERITREIAAEGPSSTVFCERTLEITPEGLVERTAFSEGRVAWSAIEKIVRTEHHAFIFLHPAAAFVVPRQNLDEGDFDSFVNAVEETVSRARTAVVAS